MKQAQLSKKCFSITTTVSTPIMFVAHDALNTIQARIGSQATQWASANGFKAKEHEICIVPDNQGNIAKVLFGTGKIQHPLSTGKLAATLPLGTYHFEDSIGDPYINLLGWGMGAYRFEAYKSNPVDCGLAKLIPGDETHWRHLENQVDAIGLVRDLINTPANDMGPDNLEAALSALADQYNASLKITTGENLLRSNLPMIHAVGRAGAQAPRLLDMTWGDECKPKVTLVGKGVCFDTGGLNIKPGNSMSLMKKDMGGAANVMGLARMIMASDLDVRLRVLIPAVENSISGNAFRPGDILPSRKGINVEIGNTDAEGRLVLADALTLGDEEQPDLMIDMATLTGAARVALGPDLPPFYCRDTQLAASLMQTSQALYDPLWHMPLWQPYQEMLGSKVADVNHISAGGFAGSITAALFLSRFVSAETQWIHLDIFGWTPKAKPWAPVGGEAQGIRTLFDLISNHDFSN